MLSAPPQRHDSARIPAPNSSPRTRRGDPPPQPRPTLATSGPTTRRPRTGAEAARNDSASAAGQSCPLSGRPGQKSQAPDDVPPARPNPKRCPPAAGGECAETHRSSVFPSPREPPPADRSSPAAPTRGGAATPVDGRETTHGPTFTRARRPSGRRRARTGCTRGRTCGGAGPGRGEA